VALLQKLLPATFWRKRPESIAVPIRTAEDLPSAANGKAAPSHQKVLPDPAEMEQLYAETLRVTRGMGTPEATAVPPSPARALTAEQIKARTLEALAHLESLPSLRSLAEGFERMTQRPGVTVEELVEAGKKDPALCVLILKQANSALVSPESRIDDLNTAVQMLGLARVRRLQDAIVILHASRQMVDGLDWRHLWIHAWSTAVIAEELDRVLDTQCGATAYGGSNLYPAALLHDVGKIVLSAIDPETYREILIAAWNGDGRLEDLERERMGVDHRKAGAEFASQNQLPPAVITAIAHHDQPDGAESHKLKTALVALANHVSKTHGLGFSGTRIAPEDPDFEVLKEWLIIEAETRRTPNRRAIAAGLEPFIRGLRSDLRTLRDGG